MRKFILWLIEFLSQFVRDDIEMLVFCLVYHTAALGLAKDEWVEFSPLRGTCGNFKLSGNSHPVFEYHVFDKSYMEFMKVRVEVAKPDKIHFIAIIDQTGHTDQSRNGQEVEVRDFYKTPFYDLAWHLFRYFPYTRKSQELEDYETAQKVQNESGGAGSRGLHRSNGLDTGA